MKVTNIILSRPLFQFVDDDPSKGITALQWQVVFASGKLIFQADGVGLVEIFPPMTQPHFKEVQPALRPTLAEVQQQVDAHPELTRASISITQGDTTGYTFHDPMVGAWPPHFGRAAEPWPANNPARNV